MGCSVRSSMKMMLMLMLLLLQHKNKRASEGTKCTHTHKRAPNTRSSCGSTLLRIQIRVWFDNRFNGRKQTGHERRRTKKTFFLFPTKVLWINGHLGSTSERLDCTTVRLPLRHPSHHHLHLAQPLGEGLRPGGSSRSQLLPWPDRTT